MLFGDRRGVREEPASGSAVSVLEFPERRREDIDFSVTVPFDDVDELFRRWPFGVGTVSTGMSSGCRV